MPLPDPVLRSVLRLASDPNDVIGANVSVVQGASEKLQESFGIDLPVVTFVAELSARSGTVPLAPLVYQHFREKGDMGDGTAMAVATRLELLLHGPPALLTGPDLLYALDQLRDEVLAQDLGSALLQASTILSAGIDQTVVHQGQRVTQRLHGPQAALTYLSTEVGRLGQVSIGAPAEGSLKGDADHVWSLYTSRRDNPLKTGVLSGITEIDAVHRGIRRGELALILGYTGHMKTTFTMSWAWRAAVFQQKNVGIVSCETPIEDLRVLLYVMHASHPKFAYDPAYLTISVDGVLFGTLTHPQEQFFKTVVEDLRTCPDYGALTYREPSADMTIEDIQRWAEHHHRQAPLDLLVIDYLGLVTPSKSVRASDTGSRLNDVIRRSKLLAMGFGAGLGVSLLSPFQASREGWKNAEKNGGVYRLVDFSWANEAEKSADLIYYVYANDLLRQSKELAMGNLKTRIVPLIPNQFRVFVDPVTRLVDNLDLTQPAQAPVDIS